MDCKHTFTLAEVFITLTVIGLVAAFTIPTIGTKINEKLNKYNKEITESRLLEGINAYNTIENGLSRPYNNTKEFLEGLSKYYKIIQICDVDNIGSCFPYNEINYRPINDLPRNVNISELITPENLGLSNSLYHVPAAFINAQGTSFIISIKKVV